MRWLPPPVGVQARMGLRQLGYPYDLKVDKFLSHADPEFSFLPHGPAEERAAAASAIKLKLVGGPMQDLAGVLALDR